MVATYEILREKLAESREKSLAESQKRALHSQLSFVGTKKSSFNKVLTDFVEVHRDAISLTPIHPLLESLWNGKTYEERLLALRFLIAFKGLLGEREWGLLAKWSETAENWALADWIAHVRAWLLRRYPERVTALINWCGSENVWVRRAAVISLLIYDPEEKERTQVAVPTRQALRVIEAAMMDTDPLVQKATAWVAREIAREAPEQLFRLLEQQRGKAPKSFISSAMDGLPERLRLDLIEVLKTPPPPTPEEMKKAAQKAARDQRAAVKAAAKEARAVVRAAEKAAAKAVKDQAAAAAAAVRKAAADAKKAEAAAKKAAAADAARKAAAARSAKKGATSRVKSGKSRVGAAARQPARAAKTRATAKRPAGKSARGTAGRSSARGSAAAKAPARRDGGSRRAPSKGSTAHGRKSARPAPSERARARTKSGKKRSR
jgi:3-methyladenine DNA glycosylase AlkD